MSGFQSIFAKGYIYIVFLLKDKAFLLKDILQIGEEKILLSAKSRIQFHRLMLLVI